MLTREVGAFQAKTHLSALVEAAEAGECIAITRRGRPVARLGPVNGATPADIAQRINLIRSLRRDVAGLNVDDTLSARNEGPR